MSGMANELREAVDRLDTLAANAPDSEWHQRRAVVEVAELLLDRLEALDGEMAGLRERLARIEQEGG